MADVRLVHRLNGSVVVVPEEKAAGLSILGYQPEAGKRAAKKSTAKKASSSTKKS